MSSKSKMKPQKEEEKGLSLPARAVIILIAALMALSPVFSSCAMKRSQDEAAAAAASQQLATAEQINAIYEESCKELEEKLAQNPEDVESCLSLANTYMNWAQMLQAFVTSDDETEHVRELYTSAAKQFEAYGELGGQEDVALNYALCLFNASEYEHAEAVLTDLVGRDPENVTAWVNLGVVCENRENYEGARAAYEKAMELDPDDEKGAYSFAESQLANLPAEDA